MKFIFPQNYDIKTRIFGIIDYSTAIVDLIWGVIIFFLINIIFKSLSYKIFSFTILVLPVIIFSVVGVNGENVIYFIKYITKYIFRQKVFLYEKK